MHHLNLVALTTTSSSCASVVLITLFINILGKAFSYFLPLGSKSIVDECIEITWISCFEDIIPANLLHRELKETIYYNYKLLPTRYLQ